MVCFMAVLFVTVLMLSLDPSCCAPGPADHCYAPGQLLLLTEGVCVCVCHVGVLLPLRFLCLLVFTAHCLLADASQVSRKRTNFLSSPLICSRHV